MKCPLDTCSSLPFFVFWDTDGTQVDSEPVHEKRWEIVAALYGVTLTPDMFDKRRPVRLPDKNGELTDEIIRPLRGAHEDVICYWIINQMQDQGKTELPALADMKVNLFTEYKNNADLIKPRDGILSVIKQLNSENFFQATVTGCHKGIAAINLRSMGQTVVNCMEFVVTANNTTHHKPHPDPYILAFQRSVCMAYKRCGQKMTIDDVAKRSFIIEDSPSGVVAGLSANHAHVIQFLNPGQKEFPVKTTEYDDSRFHLAKTASDIYDRIHEVTQTLEGKSCPSRPKGSCVHQDFGPEVLFVGDIRNDYC